MDVGISTLTLTPASTVGLSSRTSFNDRMAGRKDRTMRRGVSPTGFNGGLPYVYPIFSNFIPGEREQLCAEGHIFSHTFGRQRASLRLISHIKPRLEPRAPSLGDVTPSPLLPVLRKVQRV